MGKKALKVVDVDASYDDIVDDATNEIVENEIVEEAEESPQEEEQPEPQVKKSAPMATCDGCGKTMTVKNLKYAHKHICPALTKVADAPPEKPEIEEFEASSNEAEVDSEPEIPEPSPKPKPKAKAKSKIPKSSAETAEVPKPKKTINKIPRTISRTYKDAAEESAAVPLVRKPRAVARAEHYAKLASGALP